MLILAKPLGVGVLSAAFKQERLDAAGYAALIASTTQLNTPGRDLAALPGVHAVTDVTGFGLPGHALEMAVAQARASTSTGRPPLLDGVRELAARGVRHRRLGPQLGELRRGVRCRTGLRDWRRDLLTDPADQRRPADRLAPEAADEVLAIFHPHGFGRAAALGVVGEAAARPTLTVR